MQYIVFAMGWPEHYLWSYSSIKKDNKDKDNKIWPYLAVFSPEMSFSSAETTSASLWRAAGDLLQLLSSGNHYHFASKVRMVVVTHAQLSLSKNGCLFYEQYFCKGGTKTFIIVSISQGNKRRAQKGCLESECIQVGVDGKLIKVIFE